MKGQLAVIHILVIPAAMSLVLLAVAFSLAYVKLADVDHILIVHFDTFRGIDFLGKKSDIFGILWLGLALNVINFSLAAIFYYRERFLTNLLAYMSVFISVLILIATAVIIAIN